MLALGHELHNTCEAARRTDAYPAMEAVLSEASEVLAYADVHSSPLSALFTEDARAVLCETTNSALLGAFPSATPHRTAAH